ncbi:hypothetical protein [Actinokineospora sp.]|uniref:hypothetical protein n=1 Tax=Actinokineospora sp. TaxID=1872133 RepID=UPI004037DF0E
MIINEAPQVSVWLDVPETCRMRAEFTGDMDVQVMLGNPPDGVVVLFERLALERFVRLASTLLAIPMPDDPTADLPAVTCPAA